MFPCGFGQQPFSMIKSRSSRNEDFYFAGAFVAMKLSK